MRSRDIVYTLLWLCGAMMMQSAVADEFSEADLKK